MRVAPLEAGCFMGGHWELWRGYRDPPRVCGSPASVVATCLLSSEQAPWRDRPFLGFRRFSSELLLAETYGALNGALIKKRPSLCGGIGTDRRRGAVAGAEMPIKMRQQSPVSDQFLFRLALIGL